MEGRKIRIRVKKEDSAYVYCILEGHEGVAAYSTLPHQEGDLHRDLELSVPDDFLTEAEALIKQLEGEADVTRI